MTGWVKRLAGGFRERRRARAAAAAGRLKARYHVFRALLASNDRAVDLLTESDLLLRAPRARGDLAETVRGLVEETGEMIEKLDALDPGRYGLLFARHRAVAGEAEALLDDLPRPPPPGAVITLDALREEHFPEAGGKAAALARLVRAGGVRVPPGFVVTTASCAGFLEHEGLLLRIARRLEKPLADGGDGEALHEAAGSVGELIRGAPLPPRLAGELREAARPFFSRSAALAVRSSAVGEDGRERSFAGQYATVLNVASTEALEDAFRAVVASAFNQRSLAYRAHAGLDPLGVDMAVLCLEMIDARAAGILMTRDPRGEGDENVLVSAVLGLGEAAVSGSAPADLYLCARDGAVDWSRSRIAEKTERLRSRSGGEGTVAEAVPDGERSAPALAEAELRILVEWGVRLEEREGGPLDIEWAIDPREGPVILQARPLVMPRRPGTSAERREGAVLLRGVTASGGAAAGRVRRIRSRRDLAAAVAGPEVLSLHQSLADAAGLLDRAAGVLVDLGNPADHLACVAREYGVPLVCGLGDAGGGLAEGAWVLVDGDRGLVCEATPGDRAAAEAAWREGPSAPPAPAADDGTPRARLREVVSTLHLTDAYGPTFSIQECRSLHDLVRFCHEKGVLSLFEAGDSALEEEGAAARILESSVPLQVLVVDLGGGLSLEAQHRRRITPEMVISRPFHALWEGIVTPGVRWGPPPGGAPVKSVVSTWMTDHRSGRPLGMPNYVVVSRDYCNVNARLDFHFTMIDAISGLNRRQNHVRFRFKGGGTDPERRRRRARCIGEILEAHDFFVDVRDDLVNAHLTGAPPEEIARRLVVVGRLLGFTRLLDALMTEDARVREVSRAFTEGDYALSRFEE